MQYVARLPVFKAVQTEGQHLKFPRSLNIEAQYGKHRPQCIEFEQVFMCKKDIYIFFQTISFHYQNTLDSLLVL